MRVRSLRRSGGGSAAIGEGWWPADKDPEPSGSGWIAGLGRTGEGDGWAEEGAGVTRLEESAGPSVGTGVMGRICGEPRSRARLGGEDAGLGARAADAGSPGGGIGAAGMDSSLKSSSACCKMSPGIQCSCCGVPD
ncbi:unnamed protein product [Linum trigynum]|uniref:Uncharacterized protein n=1 Tax=Linum trigynum TaxID=586398 RepID=A0AAV2FXI1_9ROSI